ncbi:hypothetical protein D6C79_04125 [Aureobasidium pullulans]|nr:hypothetical protein D6C79_04125 [Aureobasidium pullulans]
MTRDIKRGMMLPASCQCTRERIVQKCDRIHGMSLRVRRIIEDLAEQHRMESRYNKPDGKCITFAEARQKDGATSGLWSFQTALAAVFIALVMVV